MVDAGTVATSALAGAKLAEMYSKFGGGGGGGAGVAAALGSSAGEGKCDAVRVYLTATSRIGLPQRAVTLLLPSAGAAEVLQRSKSLFGDDAEACDDTAYVCDAGGFRLDSSCVLLRHLSQNCAVALGVVGSAESKLSLRWPVAGGGGVADGGTGAGDGEAAGAGGLLDKWKERLGVDTGASRGGK